MTSLILKKCLWSAQHSTWKQCITTQLLYGCFQVTQPIFSTRMDLLFHFSLDLQCWLNFQSTHRTAALFFIENKVTPCPEAAHKFIRPLLKKQVALSPWLWSTDMSSQFSFTLELQPLCHINTVWWRNLTTFMAIIKNLQKKALCQ